MDNKVDKCACEVWLERLWKVVHSGSILESISARARMQVSFKCLVHGDVTLDNRLNPTPEVDARSPVEQYQADRMREHDAEIRQKEREDRKKNPWKYRDHRVRA